MFLSEHRTREERGLTYGILPMYVKRTSLCQRVKHLPWPYVIVNLGFLTHFISQTNLKKKENVDNSINRVRFSYERGYGIFLHEKQNAP